jgi:peptidoglycan/LPS O-acetylase OafA/YrhL
LPVLSLRDGLQPTDNSLNAFRLLLAVAVIVSHSWTLGGWGAEPALGGVTLGTWAVYGFFAVSGYLIMGSRVGNGFAEYLQRRLLRIYPAFFVCLLVTAFVVAPIAFWKTRHTFHGFLTSWDSPVNYVVSNLTLKMNQFSIASGPEKVPSPKAWDGSLWTLYYEFGCYLLVGVLGCWSLFRRRALPVVLLFLVVTLGSCNAADVISYAQNVDLGFMLQLSPAFLAGSSLYMLRDKVPLRGDLAAASAVAVVLVALLGSPRTVALAALPIAYGLLWLGSRHRLHRVGRRNDISYGVYIYGFIVEQLVSLFGGRHLGHLGYIVLSVVATVPLAAASWFLVEQPAMARRARLAPALVPPRQPLSSEVAVLS